MSPPDRPISTPTDDPGLTLISMRPLSRHDSQLEKPFSDLFGGGGGVSSKIEAGHPKRSVDGTSSTDLRRTSRGPSSSTGVVQYAVYLREMDTQTWDRAQM